MSRLEYVTLVDEQDNSIGCEEKISAHKNGLLHRAFSVFILRAKENKVQVLLQQRQVDKYHCGGLWTNACCGHPRPQEIVQGAAQRRLNEEMNFKVDLLPVGSFTYKSHFENGLTEHELDHVFCGVYDSDHLEVNPSEVNAYQWVDLDDLLGDLQQNPDRYTPWLLPACGILLSDVSVLTGFFEVLSKCSFPIMV